MAASNFFRKMTNAAPIIIIAGISMLEVEKNNLPAIAETIPTTAAIRFNLSFHWSVSTTRKSAVMAKSIPSLLNGSALPMREPATTPIIQ